MFTFKLITRLLNFCIYLANNRSKKCAVTVVAHENAINTMRQDIENEYKSIEDCEKRKIAYDGLQKKLENL